MKEVVIQTELPGSAVTPIGSINDGQRVKVSINRGVVGKDETALALHATRWVGQNLSIDELRHAVTVEGFAWSHGQFSTGNRNQGTFILGNTVGIDVDEEAVIPWREVPDSWIAPYVFAGYTSPSHAPGQDGRYGLVFLLDSEYDSDEREEFRDLIKRLIFLLKGDPSCKDPSRAFFGNPGAEWIGPGNVLPVGALIDVSDEQGFDKHDRTVGKSDDVAEAILRDYTKEEIVKMLKTISPNGQLGGENYSEWLRLCFAVVNGRSETEAREILDSWTTFKEGELDGILAREIDYDGPRVTLLTLITKARSAGWFRRTGSAKIDALAKSLTEEQRREINALPLDHGGYADAMEIIYGADLRFIHSLSGRGEWHVYNSGSYEPDPYRAQEAVEIGIRVRNAGERKPPNLSADQVGGVMKLYRSRVRTPESIVDRSNVLVCKNVTIELGGDRPRAVDHARDYLVTKRIPVKYDPGASSDEFMKWMGQVFVGPDLSPDPEYVRTVLKWLGYCLTNETHAAKFAILHGSGRNGKSTLARILHGVLGPYVIQPQADKFTESSRDDRSRNIILLKGRRILIMKEASKKERIKDTFLKSVTGDSVLIGAQMYGEDEEVAIGVKLMIEANSLPRVEISDAMFERVMIFPFYNRFVEGTPGFDPRVAEKILANPAGVLNALLQGLENYRAEGWNDKKIKVIADATETFKEGLNDVAKFIAETGRLTKDPSDSTLVRDLYQEYVKVTKAEKTIPEKVFRDRLGLIPGVIIRKRNDGVRAIGIRGEVGIPEQIDSVPEQEEDESPF